MPPNVAMETYARIVRSSDVTQLASEKLQQLSTDSRVIATSTEIQEALNVTVIEPDLLRIDATSPDRRKALMFANFAALRACEQIKTLVSYPNLNVKIVGGYAGVSDGPDGPTHHCLMDVAIMRALPNLTILEPADAISARAAVSSSTCATASAWSTPTPATDATRRLVR
mgnify:CR=1 FL=1